MHRDLFADRLNTQRATYVSWKPDPEATVTDAFSIQWKGMKTYVFRLFCLIGRCLAKIQEEGAQAVMVTPGWQAQAWDARLLHMIIDLPCLLPTTPEMLMSHEGQKHPLVENLSLKLVAWKISGKAGEQEAFQKRLSQSWGVQDDQARLQLMKPPGESGLAGVVPQGKIHFQPLWQV